MVVEVGERMIATGYTIAGWWRILAAGILVACHCTYAHHAESDSLAAQLVKDPATNWILLQWDTRPGRLYDLEGADELSKVGLWPTISTFYGSGQTVSVPILEVSASAAGTESPAPAWDEIRACHFIMTTFDNGKSLVTWHEEDAPVTAVVDLAFHQVGSLPVFGEQYEFEEPDPEDPLDTLTVLYAISASVQQGIWNSQFDAPEFDPNSLTLSQSETLGMLFALYDRWRLTEL